MQQGLHAGCATQNYHNLRRARMLNAEIDCKLSERRVAQQTVGGCIALQQCMHGRPCVKLCTVLHHSSSYHNDDAGMVRDVVLNTCWGMCACCVAHQSMGRQQPVAKKLKKGRHEQASVTIAKQAL